jgi:hypothetical protein
MIRYDNNSPLRALLKIKKRLFTIENYITSSIHLYKDAWAANSIADADLTFIEYKNYRKGEKPVRNLTLARTVIPELADVDIYNVLKGRVRRLAAAHNNILMREVDRILHAARSDNFDYCRVHVFEGGSSGSFAVIEAIYTDVTYFDNTRMATTYAACWSTRRGSDTDIECFYKFPLHIETHE